MKTWEGDSVASFIRPRRYVQEVANINPGRFTSAERDPATHWIRG
jgi:hypothetical protein